MVAPTLYQQIQNTNDPENNRAITSNEIASSKALMQNQMPSQGQYQMAMASPQMMYTGQMQNGMAQGYPVYAGNMMSSPTMYATSWQPMMAPGPYSYQMPPSNYNQNSPIQNPMMPFNQENIHESRQINNANIPSVPMFPDSPPMPDAGQLLMSPNHFQKRRQLSPLITYQNGKIDSAAFMRRQPVLKVPVSPRTSNLSSPKAKTNNHLILPCYMNQEDHIIAQGPTDFDMNATKGYWMETRRNAQAFLKEASSIDEENITIIEIKQLLRRYRVNATGKKVVLMDRVRKLQKYFETIEMQEAEKQEQMMQEGAPKIAANDTENPQLNREAILSCAEIEVAKILDLNKENAVPVNA